MPMLSLEHFPWKPAIGVLLCALLLGSATPPSALAQPQTLKTLKDPLIVCSKTRLDYSTTKIGSPFAAVLPDDVVYQGRTLPAGTLFKGYVQEVQPSRRFSRPGYYRMNLQEVVLPSGECHQLSLLHGLGVASGKINGKQAHTFKDFAMKTVPNSIVGSATSIPLGAATNLAGGVVTAIAFGARMVTGATLAVILKDPPGRSSLTQASYGTFNGTGLPGTWELLHKDKNPVFEEGATLPLNLPEREMAGLFALPCLENQFHTVSGEK